MKIIKEGKIKPYKDNYYWRCPKCHTLGYHETEDSYTGCSSEGYCFFSCPMCGEDIRDDRYLNKFFAWLLSKTIQKWNPNEKC